MQRSRDRKIRDRWIIYLLQEKTKLDYLWLAVDRLRNQIIDAKVTRSFFVYHKIAAKLEKLYKIDILCTDAYDVYKNTGYPRGLVLIRRRALW